MILTLPDVLRMLSRKVPTMKVEGMVERLTLRLNATETTRMLGKAV